MNSVPVDKIKAIGEVLNDQSRPLKERFRALFTLKHIGGKTSIACIEACFKDPSALLKHELAYCLGQMQEPEALPVLVSVLEDKSQEAIVRHEAGFNPTSYMRVCLSCMEVLAVCKLINSESPFTIADNANGGKAEAIGAIGASGDPEIEEILNKYKDDPQIEVSETCELALQRIEWFEANKCSVQVSPYNSVDPTPPSAEQDVACLRDILLDDKKTLFERYQAMFALRNNNNDESVLTLCEALNTGGNLFRHEVAFVLGQLASPASVPALKVALSNRSQHEMVRHECAEALGAVATEECYTVLQEYLADDERVVRESCEIALDMCEYENSPEFQYADTLLKV